VAQVVGDKKTADVRLVRVRQGHQDVLRIGGDVSVRYAESVGIHPLKTKAGKACDRDTHGLAQLEGRLRSVAIGSEGGASCIKGSGQREDGSSDEEAKEKFRPPGRTFRLHLLTSLVGMELFQTFSARESLSWDSRHSSSTSGCGSTSNDRTPV